MEICSGVEYGIYFVLYNLCKQNDWKISHGVVELVRKSRSFQSVLSDLINGRLDHSAVSGVVHNRKRVRGRRQKVLTVSGFEKSEIIAISHFALLNEITLSHAVEKLLLESPTFMAFYEGRTITEAPAQAPVPAATYHPL